MDERAMARQAMVHGDLLTPLLKGRSRDFGIDDSYGVEAYTPAGFCSSITQYMILAIPLHRQDLICFKVVLIDR